MSALTSVLTSLQINENSSLIILENTEFPLNPNLGQLTFVSGVLYIYSNINSFTTWYPLTNRKKSYIHNQITPSVTWMVRHNLDSQDFVFMAYDSNKNLVVVNPSEITSSGFDLVFSSAISGKVVVFVDYDEAGSHGTDANYYSKPEIDSMV